MYNFKSYCDPESLPEALSLLGENPAMTVIAGGTDVLIKIHAGKKEVSELISIGKIASLKGVGLLKDGSIKIGPLTTFSEIINNDLINERIPVLAVAALTIGGPQIRNVATIGGNISNGVPSADSASTLFVLNAVLKLQSLSGERLLPIEEFYLGPGHTDIRPGELLTEIIITADNYRGFSGHYIKFSPRRAMDIATIGVSVLCKTEDGKVFDQVRIGLGVAGPTPIRCYEAEEYARGKEISPETLKEIAVLTLRSAKVRTSWRASKEFREQLIRELTERALSEAVKIGGGVDIA